MHPTWLMPEARAAQALWSGVAGFCRALRLRTPARHLEREGLAGETLQAS